MVKLGTNHYIKQETYDKREPEHIGKSSYGWQYNFQATTKIRSYKDWMERLKHKTIINEYGEELTLEEFKELIDFKRHGKSHAEYMENKDCYKDEEGYNFLMRGFS